MVASAVDDDASSREAPRLEYEVHLFDRGSLFAIARVSWGTEGTTPYFLEVEAHSSFKIDVSDLPSTLNVDDKRRFYADMSINAAQISHGALRGHVSVITAVAPHGMWFLPTEVISAEDVKLFVGDEDLLSAESQHDDRIELSTKGQSSKKKKASKPASSK